MASLRKRGSKYYASYYAAGKEVRRSLDTSSYQVAKERLRNLESVLSHGPLDDVLPTKTPVAEIVAAFATYIQSAKSKNGVKVDFWYLRRIFGPVAPQLAAPERCGKQKQRDRLHAVHLEDIRTADIAAFIAKRVQEDGIGPKTANRYREILQRLFNWAMSQRGVRMPGGENPARRVERYRERASAIRFLSMAQIGEQLTALEDDMQLETMVALYIYAGLRREEALWLTVTDVDLKAGRHGMVRVRAKTVGGQFWEPKTKVNRVVPVSSALRPYLDRYTPRASDGNWFFPSPEGCRWDPDNFSARLREANKTRQLAWSCLDYRHTFGSHLAMKGESLYKISTLMGNSPEICRRHYAALIPEELVDCVEFGSPQPESLARSAWKVIGRDGRVQDVS